ncbi:MAG: hypothetical protein WC659_03430 [Patescibacteria group bacterium]
MRTQTIVLGVLGIFIFSIFFISCGKTPPPPGSVLAFWDGVSGGLEDILKGDVQVLLPQSPGDWVLQESEKSPTDKGLTGLKGVYFSGEGVSPAEWGLYLWDGKNWQCSNLIIMPSPQLWNTTGVMALETGHAEFKGWWWRLVMRIHSKELIFLPEQDHTFKEVLDFHPTFYRVTIKGFTLDKKGNFSRQTFTSDLEPGWGTEYNPRLWPVSLANKSAYEDVFSFLEALFKNLGGVSLQKGGAPLEP